MKHEILSSTKLIDLFGYWPDFSDAHILSMNIYFIEKTVAINMKYIDSDQNKSANITLKFAQVSDICLNDVLDENVLDGIGIIQDENSVYEISINSAYGMHGTFYCKNIDVVSVLTN